MISQDIRDFTIFKSGFTTIAGFNASPHLSAEIKMRMRLAFRYYIIIYRPFICSHSLLLCKKHAVICSILPPQQIMIISLSSFVAISLINAISWRPNMVTLSMILLLCRDHRLPIILISVSSNITFIGALAFALLKNKLAEEPQDTISAWQGAAPLLGGP